MYCLTSPPVAETSGDDKEANADGEGEGVTLRCWQEPAAPIDCRGLKRIRRPWRLLDKW